MPSRINKSAKSQTRPGVPAQSPRAGKSPSRLAKKSPRGKTLSAGEWFEKLVAVQKRLRAKKGCPWDREQTHATLRPYLIEEAYEVLDALDSGDDAKFAEEMGDLLLQVVFHSEIAREQGRFAVADVVREIHDKMVRRHPHVFGKVRASNSAQVLKNWELIKAQERAAKETKNHRGKTPVREATAATKNSQLTQESPQPASILDGVSRGLPSMLQGLQLTRKAARAGFDWHDADGIFEKLREEMAEVRHALTANDAHKAEEELGDLLFAAVNLARFVHVDPEIALKKANAKFQRRFAQMEQTALERKQAFADLPRAEMESLWDAVKHEESKAVDSPEPTGHQSRLDLTDNISSDASSSENTKSAHRNAAGSRTR